MDKFTLKDGSVAPVFDLPYQLNLYGKGSDGFYHLLEVFSNQVIKEGTGRLGDVVNEYRSSVAAMFDGLTQTTEENLLDLLILGSLWIEYSGRWGQHIALKSILLSRLNRLRRSQPRLKPSIDKLRGKLSHRLLNHPTMASTPISLANIRLLCYWLSATNEFNEEVLRIKSWIRFFELLPEASLQHILNQVIDFSHWFKENALHELGQYTSGVKSFLENHEKRYSGKEDFFLTGRSETGYHLNMVGAAIMNSGLRNEFMESEQQVLLLPSCMAKSGQCKAYEEMQGYVCAGCTKGCKIAELTTTLKQQGVQTFIVHHSSGFSNYLKRWSKQKKTGLIGTACTLNLLAGGFEMKRLGIPAQCVMLDYSGCKKHWDKEGLRTDINTNQIKKLLEYRSCKAV